MFIRANQVNLLESIVLLMYGFSLCVALNDRSAVAVLTGMVSKIVSALYIFGYRISTALSRVSKIYVGFSPTTQLHLTTHLSSSICRYSCSSAGRSKFSSNMIAIFAGISCNLDGTINCANCSSKYFFQCSRFWVVPPALQ